MQKPLLAIISFPGNNCEVESMRAIRRNGMEAIYFRWNDDRSKLKDVDGYFIPGGFSYEDRGRSGMVAGRDPLMDFIGQEAERGKVVIGNCNGAQILVESGLIPLGKQLNMSLARNAIVTDGTFHAPGFLSEWAWIRSVGDKTRCATANWEGVMHLPIAHGEGRFTTKDKDLFNEMDHNGQIAFLYCDEAGKTINAPNGALHSAAGICNPAGNVVALMPHPERTDKGDPYFASLREWIVQKKFWKAATHPKAADIPFDVPSRDPRLVEIFIDTIIVNNEERTVEQTAKKLLPSLKLKQWKYLCMPEEMITKALSDLTVFNPRKERAYIRKGKAIGRWDAGAKKEESISTSIFGSIALLRRDIPDTGAETFGTGSQTGICYSCEGVEDSKVLAQNVLEIFANPHASTLERIQ